MGASHFGGAGPLHGLRLWCIMWAMIFFYQNGMLITRLGKMARFPGQMRDELTEARFPALNLDGLGKFKPNQTKSNRLEAKAEG